MQGYSLEAGAKSWHRRACLLDGCDDWEVSADLPEWDSHPGIIKETRLRPNIVTHSSYTQRLIMILLKSKSETLT